MTSSFHFILVEPARPENVGAAARALHTMGFQSLRLVKCDLHLSDHAQAVAHRSQHILHEALVYPTLADAVGDLDFVIGTTDDCRTLRRDHLTPKGAAEHAAKVNGKIGIVFGREDNGLTNEELKLCDMISTVPMAQQFPAMNLAQTVMIYAYEFSQLFCATSGVRSFAQTAQADASFRNVRVHLEETLRLIGIDAQHRSFDRIIDRVSRASHEDLMLVLFLAREMRSRLRLQKEQTHVRSEQPTPPL